MILIVAKQKTHKPYAALTGADVAMAAQLRGIGVHRSTVTGWWRSGKLPRPGEGLLWPKRQRDGNAR